MGRIDLDRIDLDRIGRISKERFLETTIELSYLAKVERSVGTVDKGTVAVVAVVGGAVARTLAVDIVVAAVANRLPG